MSSSIDWSTLSLLLGGNGWRDRGEIAFIPVSFVHYCLTPESTEGIERWLFKTVSFLKHIRGSDSSIARRKLTIQVQHVSTFLNPVVCKNRNVSIVFICVRHVSLLPQRVKIIIVMQLGVEEHVKPDF